MPSYVFYNTNNYFEKQTMAKICMCVHFVFTISTEVFSHYCTEIVSIQKVGWLMKIKLKTSVPGELNTIAQSEKHSWNLTFLCVCDTGDVSQALHQHDTSLAPFWCFWVRVSLLSLTLNLLCSLQRLELINLPLHLPKYLVLQACLQQTSLCHVRKITLFSISKLRKLSLFRKDFD